MMRVLFLFFILQTVSVFGQTKVNVSELPATMNGIERNSLSVSVKGINATELKNEWKKALNGLKGMVVDETVVHAVDCKHKLFGKTPFEVYSIIESSLDTSSKLIAAFYVNGNNLSSTSDPDLFVAANNYLKEFAVAQSKAVVQKDLSEQKKLLKALEGELRSYEKVNKKALKDVAKLEGQVKAKNESINGNIADQKAKQSEIHRLEMAQIDNPSDDVAKLIKGYEKELDGMKKDKAGLEKDNEKLAEKVKESKAEIEQNLKDQDAKKAEITAMKKVISALGAKLDAIN